MVTPWLISPVVATPELLLRWAPHVYGGSLYWAAGGGAAIAAVIALGSWCAGRWERRRGAVRLRAREVLAKASALVERGAESQGRWPT